MSEPLRIGVVGVPGGWSSELLADAFAERTGYRLLVDLGGVATDLHAGSVSFRGVELTKLDAIVVKKVSATYAPSMLDRLEVLRYLAEGGLPVFSSPHSMLRIVDRMACTVALRGAGVPMPPTVVTEDLGEAFTAVKRFGSAVLKPLFSTKARGMQIVDGTDDAALEGALEQFRGDGNPVLYIQKKLKLPERDLGVVFIGGRYIGTYARVRALDAWNTTTASGGRYAACDPPSSVIEVAERAQAPFRLDFTSVDVVEMEEGPLVFEVSAFGGFRGLRDGLKIDPAALYADHVLAALKGRRA